MEVRLLPPGAYQQNLSWSSSTFWLLPGFQLNSWWEIPSLPSMSGVIIGHFIAFPPTQTCSCFVLYLEFLATQHCSSLPCNITTFYVKNVVGISPPLENSWYGDTSHHHHSFLGPRVDSNRGTNKWAVLFGSCPSSNPIALKLMVGRSFLDYWLLNHHSDVGRATQPIFRVHLSTNV